VFLESAPFRCCLACISGRSFKTGAIVESEWSVF
jgi:hypothetical protein